MIEARRELEQRAKELSISFTTATTSTALIVAIEKREAEIAQRTTGIPDPGPGEGRIKGRVVWDNVHSSEGRHCKGEEYHFLEVDFDLLDELDAIKSVRKRKAAPDKAKEPEDVPEDDAA